MKALRYLEPHKHAQAPFGTDTFGRLAERFARFFGTPKFILIQSAIVIVWIAVNAIFGLWDVYPFILLNLMFSTQAAYAAPLILLAQTRQADRDKINAVAIATHNQEESDLLKRLIQENTNLTKQNEVLTEEIHKLVNK